LVYIFHVPLDVTPNTSAVRLVGATSADKTNKKEETSINKTNKKIDCQNVFVSVYGDDDQEKDIPVTVVWLPTRCRKRELAEVEEREFGN
jgi:hypothetical protein